MLRVICVLKNYLNLLFHLPWFLEVDRLLNVFKILHWTRLPFLAAGSAMSLRILKASSMKVLTRPILALVLMADL